MARPGTYLNTLTKEPCVTLFYLKVILSLALAMMSVTGYAQSVIGKWVTEGGDSQVEITTYILC